MSHAMNSPPGESFDLPYEIILNQKGLPLMVIDHDPMADYNLIRLLRDETGYYLSFTGKARRLEGFDQALEMVPHPINNLLIMAVDQSNRFKPFRVSLP